MKGAPHACHRAVWGNRHELGEIKCHGTENIISVMWHQKGNVRNSGSSKHEMPMTCGTECGWGGAQHRTLA